jgi:hypothetical protein
MYVLMDLVRLYINLLFFVKCWKNAAENKTQNSNIFLFELSVTRFLLFGKKHQTFWCK